MEILITYKDSKSPQIHPAEVKIGSTDFDV